MSLEKIEIPFLSKFCNEILILAILFHEKKHGYQLALELEEKSAGHFKFNHGTLYPILHKLEKEGYIKGSWKQEGPKRKRKYYTLTSKGKKYATAQVAGWREFFEHFFAIIGEIEK
ncbi:helix-turn-helix transcriptional regulator [candidate division KSB1 bacterium]|nr:helix-turn-helix transcriptional regulator [candidate division KSB1 bacterium]